MPPDRKKVDPRDIETSFLKMAASGKVSEAYQKYISRDFLHHNAYFAGDAKSLKAGMMEAHHKFPKTTLEVQRVVAEDDLVAVHSRVRHSADSPEIAVVHIFRIDLNYDRIVELWDVGMEVPKDSPNENGVF